MSVKSDQQFAQVIDERWTSLETIIETGLVRALTTATIIHNTHGCCGRVFLYQVVRYEMVLFRNLRFVNLLYEATFKLISYYVSIQSHEVGSVTELVY